MAIGPMADPLPVCKIAPRTTKGGPEGPPLVECDWRTTYQAPALQPPPPPAGVQVLLVPAAVLAYVNV